MILSKRNGDTMLPVIGQEVRGFVLPASTSIEQIERLQDRFKGDLSVVRRHDGSGFIFGTSERVDEDLHVFGRFAGLDQRTHYRNHI